MATTEMRTAIPPRATVGLMAAAVVVFLPPDRRGWRALVAGVRGAAATPDLDAVATTVAGTALWCLAGWVVVALAVGRLAALPGACGAVGRLLVRVLVPRVLRGVVVGGVAGGLLLGPTVAAIAAPVWPTSPPASTPTTSAPTTPGPTTPGPTTPGPTWPTDTAPPTDRTTTTPTPPTTPARPAPPARPTTPTTAATSVTVAPGDSLWTIAAAGLTRAGVTPTPGAVAAAWPAWYAANRASVGPDPALLHPGTHLTAPTSTDGTTP